MAFTKAANTTAARQPVLFIPHGAGPCFFMDWSPADTWKQMGEFLRNVAVTLPQQPRAIVVVSAHWLATEFQVTGHARPSLIYDYSGFPAHTYELTYPAPGAPALASQVAEQLHKTGLNAGIDQSRGYDHGMFIPMKLMFPRADIPVIQVSLRTDLNPQGHLEAGRALASLRDEGILIVATGMSFHNMRGYGDARYSAPSAAFDEWLTAAVEDTPEQRDRQLVSWDTAPYAHDCHPAGDEEHLIPLLVAAGAAQDSPGRRVYTEQVMKTTISAFRFG